MAQTSKRGRPSKAAQERERMKKEAQRRAKSRARVTSLVLFALGVLLTCLAFIEGERDWKTLHDVLFGIFGLVAYALGPLLVYAAIMTGYEKRPSSAQIWLSIALALCVCGAFYIFGSNFATSATFVGKLKELYALGAGGTGGGAVSAVSGMLLYDRLGKAGSAVVICIAIFVLFMILSGRTVVGIINLFRSAAGKTADSVKKARERRELEREVVQEEQQRRQRMPSPDIPLTAQEAAAARRAAKTETENPQKEEPEKAAPTRGAKFDIDLPLGPASPARSGAAVTGAAQPAKPAAALPEVGTAAEKSAAQTETAAPTLQQSSQVIREIFGDNETHSESELDALVHKAARRPAAEPLTAASTQGGEPEKPGREKADYRFPPLSLLKRTAADSSDVSAELRANADKLVKTLNDFGVQTKVVDISCGPTVTRYELQPNSGVRVNRISNLAQDIALSLATTGVRIEAPIPNKAAVGIEVPNRVKSVVGLRSVLESSEFADAKAPLTVALGKDLDGHVRVADIAAMPHMLVAGATNSGKSVCLNSIIVSLIYKSSPDDVRMILIDPKSVEFIGYNGIPHLLSPVVTDPRKAAGVLSWALGEMMKRYKLFSDAGVKNIDTYNKYVERKLAEQKAAKADAETEEETPLEHLPKIVIIIDELSDLMMVAHNEVEDAICRLAQLARAAGMHLVVATQRPSVDVITGLIKANIPSRIAFAVSSQVDSRTILDGQGAEMLLGRGDMLFRPIEVNKPIRLQGCYVSEEEVNSVVDFVRHLGEKQGDEPYDADVVSEIERLAVADKNTAVAAGESDDPLLDNAIDVAVESGQISTSLLQRRLRVGYGRAARIIDAMEERGIVGPSDGNKPREVKLSRTHWQEMKLRRSDD